MNYELRLPFELIQPEIRRQIMQANEMNGMNEFKTSGRITQIKYWMNLANSQFVDCCLIQTNWMNFIAGNEINEVWLSSKSTNGIQAKFWFKIT